MQSVVRVFKMTDSSSYIDTFEVKRKMYINYKLCITTHSIEDINNSFGTRNNTSLS